NTYKELN
ncbi:hypothetical protein S7711_11642, partial [Stachybotrys chartarum IBT 7711]